MTKFRTLELATKYYKLGKEIKLSGPLRDQFLRSASSVSLNLVLKVGDRLGASLYKLTRTLMASRQERLLK